MRIPIVLLGLAVPSFTLAADDCVSLALRADDIERAEITMAPKHDDPTRAEPAVAITLSEGGEKRAREALKANLDRLMCITYRDRIVLTARADRRHSVHVMIVEQGAPIRQALEFLLQIVKDNPRARVRIVDWM